MRTIAQLVVMLVGVTAAFSVALAPHAAAQPPAAASVSLTCDRDVIDATSHYLTTVAQAANLLEPRHDFWDSFVVNEHLTDLRDLNRGARYLAERALEHDPRNLMAHSILARQYVIFGWKREADAAWRTVIDNGGAVVWTATLYDVDYKSYFLMAFGRDALRIYRMGQFVPAITRHLGYAQFPAPDAVSFYEATAGCPDPSVVPATVVPWTDVKEIKAGNWVLWFKLTRPATVVSDRNKKKSLKEIKVNLHGETGHVEFLASPNTDYDPRYDDPSEQWENVRGIGLGPYDYQQRVRDTILQFVDPENRIKRTSSSRGAGW